MSIYVQNTQHQGKSIDLLVEENRIAKIGDLSEEKVPDNARCIDGSDTLLLPGLMNTHTHAAMTLFRGYGDDLPLQTWLREKIWPAEENLTQEDVYWGTRLACLEMIRTGTTFFNDMYWHFHGICEAVADAGLRAMVSAVFIDQMDPDEADRQIEQNIRQAEEINQYPDRVQFALGPHAIYTVSEKSLQWAGEYARENDLHLHIHLSETEEEVQNCREEHGLTPVEYLDRLGVLQAGTVAAHGIWLEDDDIELLSEREVSVIHNPIANYKLASGMDFRYPALREAGIPVALGTDGTASNNNLDLFEEIKTTALIQKSLQEDPTALPATEAISLATESPADIFDLPAGRIEEGTLADFILLDLTHPSLQPLHDESSQVAYAAGGGQVHTTVCDGTVLLENGEIDQEDPIHEEVQERAKQLVRGSN